MRLALLLLVLLPLGCARTEAPATHDEDLLTVEGIVTVRGHEPFTTLLLETDQRNFYVLAVPEDDRSAFQPGLPARYRITGHLYAADWNGKPYAHLRPTVVEKQ